MDIELKKLTDEEILGLFAERNSWPLDELIFLIFGYKPTTLKKLGNGFPVRNYETAMTDINAGILPRVSEFISKDDGRKEYIVEKGALIQWAVKKWNDGDDSDLTRVYKLWVKYQNSKGKKVPFVGSNSKRIKERSKEIQVQEFIEHCKKDRVNDYIQGAKRKEKIDNLRNMFGNDSQMQEVITFLEKKVMEGV